MFRIPLPTPSGLPTLPQRPEETSGLTRRSRDDQRPKKCDTLPGPCKPPTAYNGGRCIFLTAFDRRSDCRKAPAVRWRVTANVWAGFCIAFTPHGGCAAGRFVALAGEHLNPPTRPQRCPPVAAQHPPPGDGRETAPPSLALPHLTRHPQRKPRGSSPRQRAPVKGRRRSRGVTSIGWRAAQPRRCLRQKQPRRSRGSGLLLQAGPVPRSKNRAPQPGGFR